MDIRDTKHNIAGGIDCDYMHPVHGWIPYSAHPSDTEQLSRDIYAQGILGEVADADLVIPTIPQSVTRRQARQALLLAGLLSSVQAAIDGIADPIQRGLAQIEWDDSQAFERERPLLIALATALGLDSAELDQLFMTAAGL